MCKQAAILSSVELEISVISMLFCPVGMGEVNFVLHLIAHIFRFIDKKSTSDDYLKASRFPQPSDTRNSTTLRFLFGALIRFYLLSTSERSRGGKIKAFQLSMPFLILFKVVNYLDA